MRRRPGNTRSGVGLLVVQLEPGQSRTFTNEVSLSKVAQGLGMPGTYDVSASIDGWTIEAGTVTIH